MPPATAMIEEAAVVVEEAAVAPAVACPPTGTALVARKTTLEEEAELASSFTLDRDPHDRSGDRALARLGLLEDAAPLFADAECLPRAGVLLAVPLLVAPRAGRDVRQGVRLARAGVLRPADDRGDAVSRRPCCGSSVPSIGRNIVRRTWERSWGWTGRRKSRRCGASSRVWRRWDGGSS